MKKYDVMCANEKFIEEVELYEGIAFENDEFPARYYSSCSKEQALWEEKGSAFFLERTKVRNFSALFLG